MTDLDRASTKASQADPWVLECSGAPEGGPGGPFFKQSAHWARRQALGVLRVQLDTGNLHTLRPAPDRAGLVAPPLPLAQAAEQVLRAGYALARNDLPIELRVVAPGLPRLAADGRERARALDRATRPGAGILPHMRMAWLPVSGGDRRYDEFESARRESQALESAGRRLFHLVSRLDLDALSEGPWWVHLWLSDELRGLATLGARRLIARFLVRLIVNIQWRRTSMSDPGVPDLRLAWWGGPEPLEQLVYELPPLPPDPSNARPAWYVRVAGVVEADRPFDEHGAPPRSQPKAVVLPRLGRIEFRDAQDFRAKIEQRRDAFTPGSLLWVGRHPPCLQDLLLDRIDRLPDAARPAVTSVGTTSSSDDGPTGPGTSPDPVALSEGAANAYDLRACVAAETYELAAQWLDELKGSEGFWHAQRGGVRLRELAQVALTSRAMAMAAEILTHAEVVASRAAPSPDGRVALARRAEARSLACKAWELAWSSFGGPLASDDDRRWWLAYTKQGERFTNPFRADAVEPDPLLRAELLHVHLVSSYPWERLRFSVAAPLIGRGPDGAGTTTVNGVRGTEPQPFEQAFEEAGESSAARSPDAQWFIGLLHAWKEPHNWLVTERAPGTLAAAILAVQAGIRSLVILDPTADRVVVATRAGATLDAALRSLRRLDAPTIMVHAALWLTAAIALRTLEERRRGKVPDGAHDEARARASRYVTWTAGLLRRMEARQEADGVEFHWSGFRASRDDEMQRLHLWSLVTLATRPDLTGGPIWTRMTASPALGLFVPMELSDGPVSASEPDGVDGRPASRALDIDGEVKRWIRRFREPRLPTSFPGLARELEPPAIDPAGAFLGEWVHPAIASTSATRWTEDGVRVVRWPPEDPWHRHLRHVQSILHKAELSPPLWADQLRSELQAPHPKSWSDPSDDRRKGLNIFLNVPYDRRYRRHLDLAEVMTVGAGFFPTLAGDHLWAPSNGGVASTQPETQPMPRMGRIETYIRHSRASVHDLIRVRGEGLLGLPRMNMPMEYGVARGIHSQPPASDVSHVVVGLVPAGVPLSRYLSDLYVDDGAARRTYRNLAEYGLAFWELLTFLRPSDAQPLPGLVFWLERAEQYSLRIAHLASELAQRLRTTWTQPTNDHRASDSTAIPPPGDRWILPATDRVALALDVLFGEG